MYISVAHFFTFRHSPKSILLGKHFVKRFDKHL